MLRLRNRNPDRKEFVHKCGKEDKYKEGEISSESTAPADNPIEGVTVNSWKKDRDHSRLKQRAAYNTNELIPC